MRETTHPQSLARPIGAGMLGFGLAIVTASMVATILLFSGLDWALHLHTVGLSISLAGAALGGIVAGARAETHGWLAGLLAAGLAVLACLLWTLFRGGAGAIHPALSLLRLGLACLIGAFCGALGLNFRS